MFARLRCHKQNAIVTLPTVILASYMYVYTVWYQYHIIELELYSIILFVPAADRWRVILNGEQPDYIHAVNINVMNELCIYRA